MLTKGIKIMFAVLLFGIVFNFFYPQLPMVKSGIHFLLDPTAGAILNWNVSLGMILIAGIISFLISLVQKFTLDHESMLALKKEQKILQEEMKKYKEHPEKLMELQKKQLEFIPKTLDLTALPLLYTALPIILFFRWFQEYFTSNPVMIFGFFSWFWAYLISSIIFSIMFRKILNIP